MGNILWITGQYCKAVLEDDLVLLPSLCGTFPLRHSHYTLTFDHLDLQKEDKASYLQDLQHVCHCRLSPWSFVLQSSPPGLSSWLWPHLDFYSPAYLHIWRCWLLWWSIVTYMYAWPCCCSILACIVRHQCGSLLPMGAVVGEGNLTMTAMLCGSFSMASPWLSVAVNNW